jgi:exosortase
MEADVHRSNDSMPVDWAASLQTDCKPAVDRPKPYTLAVQVGIVVALMGVLFASVLADMAHDWWIEPAWSQGMLLPPLALYIAWIQRGRVLGCAATPDQRGLLLTALACITYVLGRLASEFFLTRISFVILLAGLIWTFWGFRRLHRLGLPLLLLASMVPLPVMLYNSLAGPLQLLASEGATRIAQSVGVSVFRDGNVIQLAGVTLGVAEACSGLNSLSALIVGSLLLGYLFCSGWAARVALIVASVPLAIAVNVIRVAGTAILADFNREFAMGFYHAFSGWLVFVAGLGLLYLTARALHAILDSRQLPS